MDLLVGFFIRLLESVVIDGLIGILIGIPWTYFEILIGTSG